MGHSSGGDCREPRLDQLPAFPDGQHPRIRRADACRVGATACTGPSARQAPDRPGLDRHRYVRVARWHGRHGRHDDGRRRRRHADVGAVRRQEAGEPVRPDARGRQWQLCRRHASHQPQPEPRRGAAGRASGHEARAEPATQSAATGQACAHRPRGRFDRGADRATQGQDQALLGLRHGHPAGAAESRGLRDQHDQGIRRHLQGPARHAARHPLGAGASGVAESHGQPPRARRRIVRRRAYVQRPGRA